METIRLSQKAKEQLIWLKRQTGIKNWNVLCRWAFCLSLKDPSPLSSSDPGNDSNLEMSWKVFAGKNSEIYLAVTRHWMEKNHAGEDVSVIVRRHLHRGVNRLYSEKNMSLQSLFKLQ